MENKFVKPIPQKVRKFYFLEYFYVLLKSAENATREDRVFEQFLVLKSKHRLGESRYRKRTVETETTPNRMIRYQYTFGQVLAEAEDYGLVDVQENHIFITRTGKQAIEKYENNGSRGPIVFNQYLLKFIEDKFHAFRYLIEQCYKNNPSRSGLLIFPIYSAHRLGIKRDSLKTANDLRGYFDTLRNRLEEDIHEYLNQSRDLSSKNTELIDNLIQAKIVPDKPSNEFNPRRYNAILKRVRDFWLKYFLQDLYDISISLNAFEIWAYRAKQIGILHITQFYPDPDFSGRIVFPFSIIKEQTTDLSFKELHFYPDGKKLLVHLPDWKNQHVQEEFLRQLHDAYLDVRQLARSNFVNLMNVRERVCYSMRIPEYLFDRFLGYAYHERLRIRISLEVDKLPDETNVMYQRREPVMVDGKDRNIIAIDLH